MTDVGVKREAEKALAEQAAVIASADAALKQVKAAKPKIVRQPKRRTRASPLRASNEGPKLTLTVKEAAARLGIGVERAYEAVAQGQIPTITLDRRKVVPTAALERMLAGGP